jgi:hypothetical protein
LLKWDGGQKLPHVKFARYLSPFVFPFWIIGYPVYCYWSEFGRIVPTSEDIHTPDATWSHGLSVIPLVFVTGLFVAVLAHIFLFFFFLLSGSQRERRLWFLGTVLGLVSTGVALYLFSNLMDI